MRSIKRMLPRNLVSRKTMVFAALVIFGFIVVGQSTTAAATEADLLNTIQAIGNFISIIVLGVAVPNGAYGFLQYMTAGSNVDQDEKGRKRIRNTFIALAGVALIQIAVNVFANVVGLSPT